ncbi:TRAP transporter small permease subunit [Litorivicinus lipolyticus]|uniref:TRAP transporter small permease protein n=1 Tax=Litorivicinus lipolyticus TaxID=418701 RepID=A0A5Q2QDP9_9GAMM|nr:TRAP transporter small permease [Litorivicinus lipolyticus]QGG80491.1 TRAP transporter small permease subunit [Litorivicinus lipolyticus]
MTTLFNFVNVVTLRLAQAAIIGTLGIVSFEVIARYVFNSPTQSSLEITEYFLVAMGFLPLAAIAQTKGHVAVDLFTTRLSPIGQRFCHLSTLALTALFAAIVCWFGAEMVWHAYASETASSSLLAFPMWLAYLAIPLGFLALMFDCLRQIVATLRDEDT